MILLGRLFGAALLAVAVVPTTAAADDYVEAVGVLFGYGVRHPSNTTKTEQTAHFGLTEARGGSVPLRMATIVAPRPDNRCLLDVVHSVHDDRAGGELRQSVVDLGKIRQIEISGAPAPEIIVLKGTDLVCERAIGLPNESEPMTTTALLCGDLHILDVVNPDMREQVMPALRVVAKACDLPLTE